MHALMMRAAHAQQIVAMDQQKTNVQLATLHAQRICVVKPSAFGDVVQALPLAGALRERFPTARISWVINRELMGLLEGHPSIDDPIAFERRAGLRSQLRFLAGLRRRRFDLVIDLQGLFRSALMTWVTSAPVRIGLQTAREGARLACNVVLPETDRKVPAHVRYWRVAEAVGAADAVRDNGISISNAERGWVYECLRGLPRPIVAIHPGARWQTKRWPPERFAAVAARIAGTIVVVGSPAERELAGQVVALASRAAAPLGVRLEGGQARSKAGFGNQEAAPAATHLSNQSVTSAAILNLAGGTNLRQLAALFAACDLVVANDSGPMHLAAAMGTKVVGIFTCTSAAISGPAGNQHQLVSTSLPCAAGYHKHCPKRGAAYLFCHQEISVERVWRAIVRALNGQQVLGTVA
jgi:ADP-heptose:LPS heptosyltransferase